MHSERGTTKLGKKRDDYLKSCIDTPGRTGVLCTMNTVVIGPCLYTALHHKAHFRSCSSPQLHYSPQQLPTELLGCPFCRRQAGTNSVELQQSPRTAQHVGVTGVPPQAYRKHPGGRKVRSTCRPFWFTLYGPCSTVNPPLRSICA